MLIDLLKRLGEVFLALALVMLYPAAWVFLPRRRYIRQVELPDPHQSKQTAPPICERS